MILKKARQSAGFFMPELEIFPRLTKIVNIYSILLLPTTSDK